MAFSRRVLRALRNRIARARTRLGAPLAAHRDQLPAGPNRTVVVLADAGSARVLRRWLRAFAHDQVHVTDPLRAGDVLAGLGPVHVVVDLLTGADVDHERVRNQLFLHLRRRGTYVLGRTGPRRRFAATAAEWASRLRGAPPAPPEPHIWPPPQLQLELELAASTGRVTLGPNALLIRKRRNHLFKLREAALPEVLPRREPGIRYTDLATLPAGSFGPRAEIHHYGPATPERWIAEPIEHPAMRLRHYEGRLGFAGRSLVHGKHTILPDSYHWSLADDPRNPFTVNAGPEFARIPAQHAPQRDLDGNYYLLDPNYNAFGHIMTEVVPRLWGWDRAKAEIPDLKALFWVGRKQAITGDEPKFRIPKAYGIPAADIAWTADPVWLSSLVAPSLMWHNRQPFYVHPELAAVWQRIGRGLIDAGAPTHERIFVARTAEYSRRSCRNDLAVQQFFAERGFTVVFPELLDLGAQAALFAGAKVIAGYGGSGLFGVMFAQHLQTLIVLNHHSYTHRNEVLFAAVLGVPVHFFWSFADISHPPGGRSFAATESPWEFDFANNGPALAELLAAL